MAGISEDDKNRVRAASDLVAIASDHMTLRQRGREFWGCCPFHGEKTPSFKIDPDTQLWHCFGCGEGGDVITFVMKIDDIGFVDAVRQLARRANIELSNDGGPHIASGHKARLKEVCDATADFYHTQLMRGRGQANDSARQYLASRKLNGVIPKDWHLGFAPGRQSLVMHLKSHRFTEKEMIDANVALKNRNGVMQDRFFNRVMFPIRDIDGSTIAFGGRVIGKGEPKYLNSQETPIFHKSEVLFGLDKAKASMASSGVAVVVEGYTDVIVLSEAGIKNVVATLGTALTIQHIRVLSRHAKHSIIYLFDGDEAGQRAADRALQFIDDSMLPESGRRQVELKAVTLPDNMDPAEFVQAKGAPALQKLLNSAQPLIKYGIDRRLSKFNLQSFEDKGRALMSVVEVLAPIKRSILAQEYAAYVADRLHVDIAVVLEKLEYAKVKTPYEPVSVESMTYELCPDEYAWEFYGVSEPVTLSPQERDRVAVEREFLALCAQHPYVGMAYAAHLAQTLWHKDIHEKVAIALLEFYSTHPQASAAEVVMSVEQACLGASSILTTASMYSQYPVETVAQFLSEELSIGDMEFNVREMNAQLKDTQSNTEEDREIIYASLAALQKQLATMRLNHLTILS